jgi:hypothetical protein
MRNSAMVGVIAKPRREIAEIFKIESSVPIKCRPDSWGVLIRRAARAPEADAGGRAVQGHRDQCTGLELVRGRPAVGIIEAMGPQISSSPYLVGRHSHSRWRSP